MKIVFVVENILIRYSEWQWAAKVWQSEDNEFLAAISQYLENYFLSIKSFQTLFKLVNIIVCVYLSTGTIFEL